MKAIHLSLCMDSFERHILRKLYRCSCIGARHTTIEHCFTGLRRNDGKCAKDAYVRLANAGYLIVKPTSYGVQVSINPQRTAQVKALLRL